MLYPNDALFWKHNEDNTPSARMANHFSSVTMLSWLHKHVLEVLTLRLLILGEGRRFNWKKRKSSHVLCLLAELYTTFLSAVYSFIWYYMDIMIMIGNGMLLKHLPGNFVRIADLCFSLTGHWHVNPLETWKLFKA